MVLLRNSDFSPCFVFQYPKALICYLQTSRFPQLKENPFITKGSEEKASSFQKLSSFYFLYSCIISFKTAAEMDIIPQTGGLESQNGDYASSLCQGAEPVLHSSCCKTLSLVKSPSAKSARVYSAQTTQIEIKRTHRLCGLLSK